MVKFGRRFHDGTTEEGRRSWRPRPRHTDWAGTAAGCGTARRSGWRRTNLVLDAVLDFGPHLVRHVVAELWEELFEPPLGRLERGKGGIMRGGDAYVRRCGGRS